ncbi:serine/threonine-protein phosphatase 2A regulatory subunit B'' subunit alpha-like isoform X1 [Myxocyprinus asiaticus]|uniref:serine/threonine-protein phosphatase 2A regulatory subunit B'' subunit alpha-like isoform X1 n=1 Tax=Myxocyprinus asiaticus TaxID=70543 RepID=UPI002222A060|nr:serine/threonine-protein phosphatase 2A regulatory subunit B'' subunit alpha-like isoform X1 [Myxocyprinus asiaticus]XP_051556146.1 serine/threonine-protein phosphatase 2A regulatory subunit B'' subunit alpha-like isoform X1 [Myxocyprinus asiaticus]
MAATYRIVVSSINCYNSVVIDRRVQHTVHYCNGPCGALKHGINCTVAHRSTCAELLDAHMSRPCSDRPIIVRESKTMENGNSGPGSFCDDYHQVIPRAKKGLTIQSSASLKDITGEAINLASGKIKEFSFEKIKYSSSHVTFRKGRKVRPDSFSRRSTDLDIIYGQFTGNDENCPPFGLFQKSVLEENKLSRSASLEQNLNNVATLYLNSLTEENLISRILEKTKTDSSASGEDIKACLDILLKCSEDLKKCTDIIKQCIKRKSMGGSSDDSSNPEAIYKNVMARLSNYLKRLPLELEQGQTGRQEHSELAELVSSIHGLQQIPFSPIFGNEQPPRYEDVVHFPPPSKPRVKSSQTEPQEDSRDLASNVNPMQSLPGLTARTSPSTNDFQNGSLPSASSSSSTPFICHHTVSNSRLDTFCSTNSLLSNSSESLCKDAMEALYIEEEEADVGRMLDRTVKGDGKYSCSLSESRQYSKRPTGYSEPGVSVSDKHPELSRNGNAFKPKNDSLVNQIYLPKSTDSRLFSKSTSHTTKGGTDDIDKLLMDLECLSQNMQKEPPLPPKLKNCAQQTSSPQHQHLIGNSKDLPIASSSGHSVDKHSEPEVEASNEDDGALLLRILESIESFAQELVESGAGRGTQSKEREVMRLLQDTLASTKAEVTPDPVPVPSSENAQAPTPSRASAAIPTPASTVRDTGSTLLIQQTPEIIRIQPEKKPGTPPPTLAPAPSSPTPRPPSPPPAKAVVTTPPSSINIPRFYFPKGLPTVANYDEAIAKIEAAFTEFEEEKADIYEMGKIAKACGCPLYWKASLFICAGGERTGFVSVHSFIATWRKLLHSCYDDASKFVYLLAKPGCHYLEQEDFIPLLQDIVDTHPGLTFLKDAPEFHSRYITTVIQRIFYTVNRSWTGKINMTELRRSNFLQTLALLEEEDDINQITDYFSYEHFYVIYCKFWELDTDHDLFIDPKDLARYNDHASSSRVIERLFSGSVTRGNSVQREGRMSYAEFVWFLISEEDKKNHTSIEYWFRCMDMDGDGVLSMYELEFFYEEQCERMEGMGIEPLPFQDLLCQMLDLVKPECPGKITLRDLKRCRMAHIFYDTFFNLEKYLDHEQRDPFAVQKDLDSDGPEPSDWDKYAAEEYEILVAEETANEQIREGSFDDDYESDEHTVSSDFGNKMDKLVISDLSA